jgi:peroxiredoxin
LVTCYRITFMALWGRRKLLQAGAVAPDCRFLRREGGGIALSELVAGESALLAFFKISCPVCQLTLPYLDRIHSAGGRAIYGISQNDSEDTAGFQRSFGIGFPLLLDSEAGGFPASNAFGISTVPTLFLVERDLMISRVVESWSKAEIEWLAARSGVTVFREDENVPEWKAG